MAYLPQDVMRQLDLSNERGLIILIKAQITALENPVTDEVAKEGAAICTKMFLDIGRDCYCYFHAVLAPMGKRTFAVCLMKL